jgi:hypothetical protein
MILQMYSVYDSQTKAYTPPMFFRARGEAIRSFMEACRDEKSNFVKFPNDYSFVYCGTFDDANCVALGCPPERVISASECAHSDPPLSSDFS